MLTLSITVGKFYSSAISKTRKLAVLPRTVWSRCLSSSAHIFFLGCPICLVTFISLYSAILPPSFMAVPHLKSTDWLLHQASLGFDLCAFFFLFFLFFFIIWLRLCIWAKTTFWMTVCPLWYFMWQSAFLWYVLWQSWCQYSFSSEAGLDQLVLPYMSTSQLVKVISSLYFWTLTANYCLLFMTGMR